MESTQIGLPYPEITAIETRDNLRRMGKRGKETYFLPFDQLQIRDGFNVRKVYQGIEDLAAQILAQGLVNPFTVDVAVMDGETRVFAEQGHRRYKAIEYLQKNGKAILLVDKQGFQFNDEGLLLVECFVNKAEVDELTRLLRQFTSNTGEPYTALETAELCQRLKIYFKMETKDISTRLGISRQQVENMLILANESDSVKQSIKDNKISSTAAIELTRRVSNQQDREEFIEKKASSGETIKVKDVKDLGPRNDDEDDGIKGKLNTDKLEVQMCNEVIGSLDKIYAIVKKLVPGTSQEAFDQAMMDVEHQIDMDQKKMDAIRSYVNKCTK